MTPDPHHPDAAPLGGTAPNPASGGPEVWLVLPSANPANCARTLPLWRERGYRVAVLQDRVRFECDADAVVTADRYPGWAGSVNRLCHEAVPASADIVVAAGDDMHPHPDRTAQDIAGEFLSRFADTPGGSCAVMQPTGDDFEATGRICGSPWLGRAWMERMYRGTGGMCDAYVHQWADDELYWVARCAHALWERPDLRQHHDHFRRRGDAAPTYWVDSAARHDRGDCLTFIARAHAGFPGAEALDDRGPRLDLDEFRAHYRGHAEAAFAERHAGGKTDEPARRLTEALERCARDGLTRVAVFGAGQHTRKGADALCTPPVDVVAIIDQDPSRIGTRLWGIEVIDIEHAKLLSLDAVVLSSDAMEPALRAACAPLAASGVRVVSLYGHGARVGSAESTEPARAG